ncbi:hypothetical protein CR513_30438, partial [Mucuna pruriens]
MTTISFGSSKLSRFFEHIIFIAIVLLLISLAAFSLRWTNLRELKTLRRCPGSYKINSCMASISIVILYFAHDALLSIGKIVSLQEQLDVVLDGLPADYESLVFEFDDIESLLLAHKSRINKLKDVFDFVSSLNPTQPKSVIPTSQLDIDTTAPQVHYAGFAPPISQVDINEFEGFGSEGGCGGRFGMRGGCGDRGNNQC